MRFLLQGLGMTLLISALAILCSVVLGTVISVMRTSNARVLRGIATVYIEIFKNTPLLLWIMFTFFVAQLPPIGAAVLAFTLFTSGFPAYPRTAASMAAGSLESTCKGAVTVACRRPTAAASTAGSSISGRPTFTSRMAAPASCWATASPTR